MHNSPNDYRDSRPDSRELIIPSHRAAPLPVHTVARQAGAAPAESAGISHHTVLDAIRFWWKWALPSGLVLGALACAITYLLFVPKYQASAWLRIEERAPFLAFESKDIAEQSKGFVQTQIEMLRSPMVLKPVAGLAEIRVIPELAKELSPAEWLSRKLTIKAVGNSELYTVSFTSSQPEIARRVANAVVDSYFELLEKEQNKRLDKVIDILDKELEKRAEDVDLSRKAVREKAKEVTGKDPFQTNVEPPTSESKLLADLANRLISTEVEETVLKAKLQAAESVDGTQRGAIPDSVIEQHIAANPKLLKALEVLEEKRGQLGQLEDRVARGKEDPVYQKSAKLVAQGERQIEVLKSALRTQVKLQMESTTSGKWNEELSALRADLDNRRMTREIFKERYEAELKNVKQNNGDTVSLKFKQDELARAEKVHDLISDRIVKLRTEKGAPPRVYLMKEADLPTSPVQPMPYLNMALAALAAMGLPFGLAIVKEQLTKRVHDADSVERHSDLHVLGEITRLPTRNRAAARLGFRAARAVRLFEESVETLRTSLLLGRHANSIRILTVTSAVTEEGKTSVAVQLAVSIARATQERTLLIDGDMRDPSIHQVFQVAQEPGLTNVLADTCVLEDAITVTWAEGVDVLPAGVLAGNPHALLGNNRWERLLRNIPDHYRYVVIDTPPVLAASEALTFARDADAVLICAMRDVTRLPQLKRVAEHVVTAGGKIAGVVLNGTPTSHYAQRYGSYPYLNQ